MRDRDHFALDWGRTVFFAAPVIYVAGPTLWRGHRKLAVVAVVAFVALDVGYAGYIKSTASNMVRTAPPRQPANPSSS